MSAIIDFAVNIRTPQDLGLVIRDERKRQGLDQRTLAAKAGVSRQWIIETERGKAGAPIGLLLRTLNALGVTLRTGPSQPTAAGQAGVPVDINSVVERARSGKR